MKIREIIQTLFPTRTWKLAAIIAGGVLCGLGSYTLNQYSYGKEIKIMARLVAVWRNPMPLFQHNFLYVSTSCNKCTMTRLKVLSFRSIRNRFIYYLFEHQQKDSNVVELEHTQEQLAEYFGVTRPALSKEIGRLVDEGFISITRRKETILNKTALICML